AAHTGWITPTEGILINDIHPDTNAVTADELLGAYSGDGFADLAALDSNGDGKIDANDAAFASLRVWRDANGNGVGDTGELITLAVAGITAINLNAQSARQNINGNVVTGTSTFVRADGTTATIAEVQFSTDSLYTQFTPPPGFQFSPTAYWLLPDLIGYGNVPELVYSMSMNPDLEAAVMQLVLGANAMNGSEFDAAFEAIVQKWAGADTIDPASRGPYVDARHMAVVEAFYGTTYE